MSRYISIHALRSSGPHDGSNSGNLRHLHRIAAPDRGVVPVGRMIGSALITRPTFSLSLGATDARLLDDAGDREPRVFGC